MEDDQRDGPAPCEELPAPEAPPQQIQRLLGLLSESTQEHAIMLLDTEGRIIYWNVGAERIFGLLRSEAMSQPVARLFTPEDRDQGLAEHEIAIARSDGAAEDDRWMERIDGSRFWATGLMVALRDEDGSLLAFGKILRSRSDLREQFETLQNRIAALDASARRKDIFLSTLSHELRNPLAPLNTGLELVRMAAPETPDLDYPLKLVERQVQILNRLVDDLLDLSRIGAGKIALKKESVVLQTIVERAVESAQPLLRGRRHRLEVLLPPVPLLVDADPDRLVQVFVNLLNNAGKYTPDEGRIWVKGTVEADEAVVHVKDTGVGIPHDMLPRVFEMFTQAEGSRPYWGGGLGVGLAVVKELVTLHNGSVQVRSEGPGKGSEFTVRLPLGKTPDP